MEISKNQIVDLLVAYIHFHKNAMALDNVLGSDAMIEYFGVEMDSLLDEILDLCGVPEEGTDFEAMGISFLDFLNKDDGFAELNEATQEALYEGGFCRDGIYERIWSLCGLQDDEIDLASDVTVISIIDRFSIQENYIVKRDEQ